MLSCLNHYEGDCTRKVVDFILSLLAMAKLKQAALPVWLNENVHIILYVQIQMGRCRLIFACNMVCCLFDAHCDGRLQFLFPSI